MSKEDILSRIQDTVKELKPESVNRLIDILTEKSEYTEEEILDAVVYLENNDMLRLVSTEKSIPDTFIKYVISWNALWLWSILGICIITSITLFTIMQSNILLYVRYVFGSIFILFLPGYTLIKSLFPTKGISDLERISLSIGLSIAISPLIGLLLNYTPWGITVWTFTPSLLAFVIILAFTGLYREYNLKIRM